ncbi:MAG TPA: phosphatidate cytidylyltransferase [Anaeromyxobacteraceae bacterium]|nr:phosphatidate cytidylyltransferase [Anaeromyxobacteraceae bacterium]
MDPQRWKSLQERVASAAILVPIVVGLTWLGGWPFAALVAVGVAVAASELVLMFAELGVAEALGVAVAAAIPLAAATAGDGLLPAWAPLALAGATVAVLAAFLFRRKELAYLPRGAGAVALSWLWVGLLAATVVRLRALDGGGRAGFGWVLMAFAVTWGNDTFAYFAGLKFGRHRLYERISPKKSWEGAVGGVAGALVGAFLVRALLLPGLDASTALAAALGGSVVGPLGDLSESMVKRAAGVKDSGNVIPGHGGVLDRIDALLFVAPWVYACALLLR